MYIKNTDKILTVKFYNKSNHFNFQANGIKLEFLSINLVYYALVIWRQHMEVWRPLNDIYL